MMTHTCLLEFKQHCYHFDLRGTMQLTHCNHHCITIYSSCAFLFFFVVKLSNHCQYFSSTWLLVISLPGDDVSCPLESEKKNHAVKDILDYRATLSPLSAISLWSRCSPRAARMMDSSELEREVGERAWRDGERERDDRGENKQCVCFPCGQPVCAALCHVGMAAGVLALCSSHPISLLTDCPDRALLCCTER